MSKIGNKILKIDIDDIDNNKKKCSASIQIYGEKIILYYNITDGLINNLSFKTTGSPNTIVTADEICKNIKNFDAKNIILYMNKLQEIFPQEEFETAVLLCKDVLNNIVQYML